MLAQVLSQEARRARQSLQQAAQSTQSHWYLRLREFETWRDEVTSSMLWHIENGDIERAKVLEQVFSSLDNDSRGGSVITFHLSPTSPTAFDNRLTIYRSLLSHLYLSLSAEYFDDSRRVLESLGFWNSETRSLHNEGKKCFEEAKKEPKAAFGLLKRACRTFSGRIYMLIAAQDSINLGEDIAVLKDLWELVNYARDPISRMPCALKILVISHQILDENLPVGIPTTDIDTERKNCLHSLLISFDCDRPNLAKAQPGTNKWMKDHDAYQQWKKDHGSRILWLEGEAGCGKSTLVATIVQQTEARDHFYLRTKSADGYDDGDVKKRSFTQVRHCYDAANQGAHAASHLSMFRSLLRQIVFKQIELFPIIRPIFRSLPQSTTGERQWTMNDLKLAFQALADANDLQGSTDAGFRSRQSRHSIVLLIDAFDESEDGGSSKPGSSIRCETLNTLESCCKGKGYVRFKVIMSSRPLENSELRMKIRGFHVLKVQDNNYNDVMTVIDTKINSLGQALRSSSLGYTESDIGDYEDRRKVGVYTSPVHSPHTALTHSPKKGYLATVAEYAEQHHNGILLWVKLMIEEMESFFLQTFRTRVNVTTKLLTVPRGLVPFYGEMIKQLLGRFEHEDVNYPSSDLRTSRTLLTWACFTAQPLTVGELREVLACSSYQSSHDGTSLEDHRLGGRDPWESTRQTIYYCCGNLLRISSNIYPQYLALFKEHQRSTNDISDKWDVVSVLHLSLRQCLRSQMVDKSQLLCMTDIEAGTSMSSLMQDYLLMSLYPKEVAWKEVSTWDAEEYDKLTAHLEDRPLLSYILKYLPGFFRRLWGNTLPESFDANDLLACLKSVRSDLDFEITKELLANWLHRHSPKHTWPLAGSGRFQGLCLVSAIRHSRQSAVSIMLDLGTNPNIPIRSPDGDYPLLVAIKKRSKAMVMALLNAGASKVDAKPRPDVRARGGKLSFHTSTPPCLPLQVAVEVGDMGILEILLRDLPELGVSAQKVDDHDLWRAFELRRDDFLLALSRARHDGFYRGVAGLHFSEHSRTKHADMAPYALDTGSQANFISMTMVEILNFKYAIQNFGPEMRTFKTFTSKEVKPVGWIDVYIDIHGFVQQSCQRAKLWVIDEDMEFIILCWDFFKPLRPFQADAAGTIQKEQVSRW